MSSDTGNKVVTIGSLIKKDLKEAYYLPSWPSTNTREAYRFINDKKYRVYDCPPPPLHFNEQSFPFINIPTAGDEVPVLLDFQPPRYLKKHWKKWQTAFQTANLKTIDQGLLDDVPIVTTAALQSIPEIKHSVDPDVLYEVQLKRAIPEIGVPCPAHMEEKAVECPCLVKVDQSCSGRGTLLAKNKHELSAILKEIREENGWKESILFQEVIQGIKEVPSFQFHLHKSGEIYWVGTTCGGFLTGFSWTSAYVDWDAQDYYKNLVWDKFTIPITKYLQKKGYFGLVTFEILITDHGMYLCDLNPRVSADTTHLLLSPYMAQMGYTHSCLMLNIKLDVPPKTIVENANDVNNAIEGRVIVISATGVGNGCQCDFSIFAKTHDELKVIYDKVTHL